MALAALPIVHIAGLALLLLSFWTIYERGYVDNDFIAAHYEHDPKLSRHYHEQLVATPTWQPWIWALAAGAAAVYLLCGPLQPKPSNYLAWACALAATYGWFKLYNRVDKDTRVWMFPFLQLARSAALVVLVPITAVGAAIIGAQVLARWVPYYVYRLGKKDWPKDHTHLIRVIFFVILAMMLIITQGPRAVFNWTGAAVFFWALYRARHEIRTAAQGISLLSRSARPR